LADHWIQKLLNNIAIGVNWIRWTKF